MKNKMVSVILVIAMTATMIVGCGAKKDSKSTSDGADSKGQEITFMVPDWGVPTDEQLAAFSKNTGIKVNIAEAVGWLEPLDVSNEDKDDIPTIETFTIDDKVLAMP
ncbi:MAG: sugar ABC transporter substrate-binding protein, partial [Lachnospiraceae bacterium]